MMDVSEALCPENTTAFENIAYSEEKVQVESKKGSDLLTQLNDAVLTFAYFSIALNDSTDASDKAQLLIFIRGVKDKFDVISELLSMGAMKGTIPGEALYERLSTTHEWHKLQWNTLISVTTDGSPYLTGNNIGLLKSVRDSFRETCSHREMFLSHYISHQGLLSKTFFKYEPCEKHSYESCEFHTKRLEPQTVHIPATRFGWGTY
jgi:hypothetical protein